MKILTALLAWCVLTANAAAQTVPSEPLTFGGGRVVLGGDAAVSLSAPDRFFFNYSDYEHSTLREFRLALSAQFRLNERLSVLGELRSENLQHVEPFALYARVRPFPDTRLDVQIGRIPPTFGRFPRSAYSRDNPLIGYPLAYQYLTSLRANAVPANADELLRMRGRGWLSSFSVGSATPERGVPLVTAFTWDTGVQVSTGWRAVTVAAAMTNGTASNPRVSDDNDGKQLAARVSIAPSPAFNIGTSFARGAFLDRDVHELVDPADDRSFSQRAHGIDAEYSWEHIVLRADGVLSQWEIPLAGERTRLRAGAVSFEAKYTFMPGAYTAARVEHLTFSRIHGTAQTAAWDAPVTRLEVGGGYYLQRNIVARLSLQFNERDTSRGGRATFLAGQLLFWF